MSASQLIVITGPSGVGKGTLVRALLARHPELHLSISATTRSPRPSEIDGQDYFFVARQEFEAMIEAGELLEWAEYAGNYYGTLRTKVTELIHQGQSVVLEIELVGARAIQETFSNALRLFILPPSITELERRLRSRGNVSEAAIALRLKRAQEEIAAKDEFDRQIINDDFETALKEMEAAILESNGG